jgi:hypothetical protein
MCRQEKTQINQSGGMVVTLLVLTAGVVRQGFMAEVMALRAGSGSGVAGVLSLQPLLGLWMYQGRHQTGYLKGEHSS